MTDTPSSSKVPAGSVREGLRSTSLAIGLFAGAVMIYELALIRIFSFTTWHHYAFMVISIALLGFGVSGVVLEIWPAWGRPPRRRAALAAGVFALSGVGAVLIACRLRLDIASLATDRSQIVRLLLTYVLLVLPFTAAGLAIVTLLGGYREYVGRLYGCDLLGAAFGCFAFVAWTGYLGVEGMVVIAAAVAAASATLLAGRAGRARLPWALTTVALLLSLPSASRWMQIPPGPGKALERHLEKAHDDGARIGWTRWSALFRTDVIENSHSSVPWTENPFVDVTPPRQHQIVIDGDAMTSMIGLDESTDLSMLDYMLPSLGLQGLRPERVLVIGAGGGVDVLAALHHGARQVDAVEVNREIVRLGTEDYASWNGGLYLRDDVDLHLDEGRSFVRRSSERFDLIQLSLVDTFASSAAGAYSLAEGYLYTVEAFEDYLAHLSDRGVVNISRWLRWPPRETLRLVTIATQALERRGVEVPERHLVVAANGRVGCLLVKAQPFTVDELQALVEVGRQRSFSFLFIPGQPETDNEFAAFLRNPDRDAFFSDYPLDVTPSTDDRPFFFQFGRWDRLSAAGLSGKLVLLVVLAQAAVLSLLLLVLPMARRRGRAQPSTVGYFLSIGIAFMLLEIALMQRFTLYLGHPVYGIVAVLAAILLGAGVGSLAAPRLVPEEGRVDVVFAALIGAAVLSVPILPPLFHHTLGWPLPARLLVSSCLLLPLGFLLGVPFPAAMARLDPDSPQVGWAWAANGCGSVLGPLLAMILAIDWGFSRVMLIAALLYAMAYWIFRRRWERPSLMAATGT